MPTKDPYLDELKLRKLQLEIDLKAVNTEMANIRANYSERQSNFFFPPSRRKKDKQLRKLQPIKQQLQAEILDIRQEIALVKAGEK